MIKAVLFDMDGVLIDTEKYLTQFWQQAAAEAGLSLTMEDCYQFRSFASKFASVAFQEKYGKEYAADPEKSDSKSFLLQPM